MYNGVQIVQDVGQLKLKPKELDFSSAFSVCKFRPNLTLVADFRSPQEQLSSCFDQLFLSMMEENFAFEIPLKYQ